ncbi:MAG TPA: choice-of-anchor Q domain-containing protein [Candidatus Acidoferrales bacterium]|nr:choice-of-anchor Q domain-containing protein [Candidatus Acidoferrales bacterium]
MRIRIVRPVLDAVVHSQFRSGRRVALAAILLFTLSFAQRAAANIIYVTTLADKISTTGGCSLKEAIYSANFESNLAIASYDPNTDTPQVVTTQCVPGSGDDIIVLPVGQVLQLNFSAQDASNPMGPTATPMITSNITIEAYGATLEWVPVCPMELNYIECPDPAFTDNGRLFAVGGTGHLTVHNAYIKGFLTHGGNGAWGGGGGMGAGGAIYVQAGGLVVEDSTFDGNGAVGGNGGGKGYGYTGGGGGGGGLGGNGGYGCCGGGGGGGSTGDGFASGGSGGGGGGGTVFDQLLLGGFDCGGIGGIASGPEGFETGTAGSDAPCYGGGGGGGGYAFLGSGDGGSGNYGGGGGGGADGGGNGGNGGFGGGGGAGWAGAFGGTHGGTSAFGGGGGGASDGYIIGGGNPGNGGMFGGNANSIYGGGGAALGGAIFNDSGSVLVENSTFISNYVTRGVSGGGSADNGQDAGAALFTVDGHLTVHNATISGNQSTGSGGGIVIVQTSPDKATSLSIDNTIIFNNGSMDADGNLTEAENECWIASGFSVAADGAGNLIQNNNNCEGVVSTDDPQLGPLQNNGGFTPTMAIAANTPAWNAADPGTSLGVDQRGQIRPEMGGFDIGAFELCVSVHIIDTCGSNEVVLPNPEALIIQVSPAAGGTTTPAPGDYTYQAGTIVPLQAIPNPGYSFSSWNGNVGNQQGASTSIVMLEPQTVTANFALCNCVVDVSGYIGITRLGFVLNLGTGRYAQTVTLTNNSAVTIIGPISLVLDNLSGNAGLFNANGSTDGSWPPVGSPYITANVNLAPGQNTVLPLQFTDPTHAAITYTTRVLAGPGAR